ncbi:MAG: Hpt domain-containing protein, partial [Oligoflexales bacterium]|nr:Hpt domain-containing protein [Oligoflexales bacterium]
QGIFTVADNLTIGDEYSQYLEKVFDTKAIEGRSVMDLLFQDTDFSKNDLDQVKNVLELSIKEKISTFKGNSHLLPREITKNRSDGSIKILEIDWNAVKENGIVESILVTIRDVTDLKKLQIQAAKQTQELAIIEEIISVSEESFAQFMTNSHKLLQQTIKIVNQPVVQIENMKELSVDLHTLKGNARTLKLKKLVENVHCTEDLVTNYLNANKPRGFDLNGELREMTEAIGAILGEYHDISEKKLNRSSKKTSVSKSQKQMEEELLELLKYDSIINLNDQRKFIQKTRSNLYRNYFPNLETLISDIIHSIGELAVKLDKQSPRVSFAGNQAIGFRGDCHEVIHDAFMHIMANSMDHGIENAQERNAAGKDAQGVITIDIDSHSHADQVLITYADDGRGLNLPSILKKGVDCGLIDEDINLEPSQIAQFIFESGFSTAEKVSDVSGRGAGMRAVKEFLGRLGGEIEIELSVPAPIEGYIHFRFRILIPRNLCIPYEGDDIFNNEATACKIA